MFFVFSIVPKILQLCSAPTRNLQNIKAEHVLRCTAPYPRVASVEPPWLETTELERCVYLQDVLCSAVGRIV